MKKITVAVRILLGLIFVASGIAFFLTTPPPLQGDMATFFAGMAATKYFFYLLKGTEIICGLFLLSGFFVPLALVVLAPVVLNIFFVHAFLAPEGIITAIVLGVMMVYLAFFSHYSVTIKQLFKTKN